MQFVKKIVKRYLRNNELYKMASYFRSQYRLHAAMRYSPEDFAVFEEGAVVENGVDIYHPNRIVLRFGSVIHRGSLINAAGGLHLGKCSGISYNCTIFTGDHRFLKAEAIPFDQRVLIKPVYIEDFVMIGTNVCIAPGVRVGEGAVIGMGSVLTKDVPPLAIVSGNPADVAGYRDSNHFQKLKQDKAFQCPVVESYDEKIPLMYQRKYKEFLEIIGLNST